MSMVSPAIPQIRTLRTYYAPELDADVARMQVSRGDDALFIVDFRLGRRTAQRLMEQVQMPLGRDAMARALLRFAVTRLEQGIRQGIFLESLTSHVEPIIVQEDDLPIFRSFLVEKTCSYQEHVGRELYCSAAGSPNVTERDPEVRTVGIRDLAPTSRLICLRCTLPDTDYLCSHLKHPRVGRVGRDREVYAALCDIGQPEISSPEKCRPGGNACWTLLVEPMPLAPPVKVPPLALAEAFDHFALAWERAIGRPVFPHRSIASDAALEMECKTAAELNNGLSKLASVLNDMIIDDDLLPAGVIVEAGHKLTRMLESLKGKLPAAEHPAMERAIGQLRAVNTIRTADQHGPRRRDVVDGFHRLDLPWPATDTAATWDGIKGRTVDALRVLREALGQLPSKPVQPAAVAQPATTTKPKNVVSGKRSGS